MEIDNKKILIIMPKYFGYDKEIAKALYSSGAETYFIYENMDEVSGFYRFVYVYAKQYKAKVMDRYYEKIIEKIPEDIDIVLVIRGASLSRISISRIRKKFKNAKYIFYHWDSIKNNEAVLGIMDQFDRVLTFDMDDSEKYGWVYRPLFYTQGSDRKEKPIDVLYICSLHSERMKVLSKIKEIGNKTGLTIEDYLYSNFFHYIKQRYIKRNIGFSYGKVSVKFKPLSLHMANELYSKSKIVIDYTHPNQNGFTIRTIESIGNRCKLLTNNVRVRESDFYCPENVYIYDIENFDISKDFLEREYQTLTEDKYHYYSLCGWIEDVMELDNEKHH